MGNNSRVAERGIVFVVMLSICWLVFCSGIQETYPPETPRKIFDFPGNPLTPFPCYFIKGRGIDKRGGFAPSLKSLPVLYSKESNCLEEL